MTKIFAKNPKTSVTFKFEAMKKIVKFILFLFLTTSLIAQEDKNLIEVFGKVINANTLRPVPYAFVINPKENFGTKTDTSGKFRILMTPEDTLRISSLGFQTTYWQPDFSKVIAGRLTTTIYLPQIDYKLPKVDIYQMRWNSFVQDIANTEVKEDETQKRIVVWISKVLEKEHLNTLANLSRGTGVVIPLPLRTKHERQLRKLSKIQQQDELQREIDKKFNKELVAKVTGLKGKELDYFISLRNCSAI